jgi:hypothetical protein
MSRRSIARIRVTVGLLLPVAVLLSVSLGACGASGGGDSSVGVSFKTYTNSQYGFSIAYPSDWLVQKQSPAVTKAAKADLMIAFHEPKKWGSQQTTVSVAHKRDASTLNRAQVTEVLRMTQQSIAAQVDTGGTSDMHILRTKIATLDGAPCLIAEATYTDTAGAQWHREAYYVICRGREYYSLKIEVAAAHWQAVLPSLRRMVTSFALPSGSK